MSAAPFSSEDYAVFQFTLVPSASGKPMQRTESCGVYRSIEDAFTSARLLAIREWQRLRAMAAIAPGSDEKAASNWQVIDTEFGYDLKRDHLVVSRFWIHTKHATSETAS
jgi:hypothetical protein